MKSSVTRVVRGLPCVSIILSLSVLLLAAGGEGDQDGDGINDKEDDCPAVAGAAPTGCPKPDKDGDGWWDGVDSCIKDPEDPNGIKDDDGCPDDPDLVERGGVVKTRGSVVFTKGRASAPRNAQHLAKAIARWMKADPRAQRVEVMVVVDPAEGKRKVAETLAQDRAEVMAAVLGAAGLRSESVVTRVVPPSRKPGLDLKPRTLHLNIMLGAAPRPQGGARAEQGARDGGVETAAAAHVEAERAVDGGGPDKKTPAAIKSPPDAGGEKTARRAAADAGTRVVAVDAGADKTAKRTNTDAGAKAGVVDAGVPKAVSNPSPDAGKARSPSVDAGRPVATPDAGRPKPPPPPDAEELLNDQAKHAAKPDAGSSAGGSANKGSKPVPDAGANAEEDVEPDADSPQEDDWDKDAWEEGRQQVPEPSKPSPPAKGKSRSKKKR